jgi:hypothetical protein
MSEIFDVDCGFLAVVQAMAADRWKNAANRKDYIANVNAALALIENQSGVNLIELKDPGKRKKVSLEWPTKCDLTIDDCSTDICTITGTDVTPECKEYEIECLGSQSFAVNEFEYRDRTMEFQQALADNFNRHLKVLDERVAAVILAGLDANGGTNEYNGDPGTVVGDTTTIGSADWNEHIFSYLALVTAINRISSPTLLSGVSPFFRMWWEISRDQANADGKGAANKLSSIGTPYFDLFNIPTLYPNKTYLFDNGAAYFTSKVWYPAGAANAMRRQGTDLLYSIPSNNIPGVNYDVIVREVCSANDYQTQVLITLNGIMAINPVGCTETNTGILIFECA